MSTGIEQRADVVVVGGGFAGTLVADRLGRLGWDVLVLEAGPGGLDYEQEHQNAVRTFRAAVAKTPDSPYQTSTAAPSVFVFDPTGDMVQHGELTFASHYVRTLGGTGRVWTGNALRMHPEDFASADLGHGRNWPIGYDDLEPFYREAERELGVSGDAREQCSEVGLPMPDDYVYPMHEIPRTYLDRVLDASLGGKTVTDTHGGVEGALRLVSTPQARNGEPNAAYDGGAGFVPAGTIADPGKPALCEGSASCMPICPNQAKYTPLRTQRAWPAAVRLATRSVVDRVLVDEAGRATGVQFQTYDADGRASGSGKASAKVVIIAGHAIENAVLLLRSGIANSSDQVGRNLMDHPMVLTWARMPQPVGPYRGPTPTSGIETFRFGAARGQRAPFRIEIGNWGWDWACGSPASRAESMIRSGLVGAELRAAIASTFSREFNLHFAVEQEADPSNRVTISMDHVDTLGNPRPQVDYALSDYVKKGVIASRAVSRQIYALLGAEDHTGYEPGPTEPGYFEYEGESYAYRGGGHIAGTHIMGTSPTDSVVDQWQRCWDNPNLFAIGCGSMPSMGTSNPSLTMAALALRSVQEIHRELLAAPGSPARHGSSQ